jgi:hypothetical protein
MPLLRPSSSRCRLSPSSGSAGSTGKHGWRCSSQGGVAEGGEVLDAVSADRGSYACMLAGEDGCTLYIVANRYGLSGASDGIVLFQRVAVPHAGRP